MKKCIIFASVMAVVLLSGCASSMKWNHIKEAQATCHKKWDEGNHTELTPVYDILVPDYSKQYCSASTTGNTTSVNCRYGTKSEIARYEHTKKSQPYEVFSACADREEELYRKRDGVKVIRGSDGKYFWQNPDGSKYD